jgi:hypothetical protein
VVLEVSLALSDVAILQRTPHEQSTTTLLYDAKARRDERPGPSDRFGAIA